MQYTCFRFNNKKNSAAIMNLCSKRQRFLCKGYSLYYDLSASTFTTPYMQGLLLFLSYNPVITSIE